MKTAILASGGMDSFITWALHPDPNSVMNVFVNINQKYANKETWALRGLGVVPGFQFTKIQGPDLNRYETPSGIIPNRNAHLILAAAAFGTNIQLGVLKDEINSDKSPEFFSAMEQVLNISNRGQYWNDGVGQTFTVSSPLRNMTKTQAVGAYLNRGFDPLLLVENTVSCYSDEDGHCGQCPSCFKRWVALTNHRLPSKFNRPPLEWAKAQGILDKCRDGTYGKDRADEILMALTRNS